ncbi:hypothetical protein TWF506_010667 [Arthrobotrys conoides]|uniref:Uncharacterized protein n=1 Tax=Arthrobotrys conoides TaxID=74498 RepID=A0AAN8N6S9_9PEZI
MRPRSPTLILYYMTLFSTIQKPSHAVFTGDFFTIALANEVLIPSEVWSEWLATNAATLRSIGQQLDISKKHAQSDMRTINQGMWTPGGITESPSAKYAREQLGWAPDSAENERKTKGIIFGLGYLNKAAFDSWRVFNDIDMGVGAQDLSLIPEDPTNPETIVERAFELGKWIAAMHENTGR